MMMVIKQNHFLQNFTVEMCFAYIMGSTTKKFHTKAMRCLKTEAFSNNNLPFYSANKSFPDFVAGCLIVLTFLSIFICFAQSIAVLSCVELLLVFSFKNG